MEDRDFSGRLIMGSMLGVKSPVIQHADTLYADIRIAPNGRFPIPPVAEERAIYTLQEMSALAAKCFHRIACWRFVSVTILSCRPGRKARISCFWRRGAWFEALCMVEFRILFAGE